MADHPRIFVPVGRETVTYVLLFAYGRERTLIYSVWDIEEMLNHVWSRYAGEEVA